MTWGIPLYLRMGFYSVRSVFALLLYILFFDNLGDASLVTNDLDKTRFCDDKNINELFNSNNHVCCGGILHPRNVNGSVQECCSTEIYSKRLSLCCSGIYHPNYNIDQYGCCGSKVYNFKDEMCCGSIIHRLNLTRLCCGNETFDPRLQWCSSDMEILDLHKNKCGKLQYDIRKSMCCNKTLLPGEQKDTRCCGSSSFNHVSHYCVRGKVLPKGFLWCQHHGEYNPTIHDCCEGRLFRRNGSNWGCCGSKMINYDEFSCCTGNRYHNRNEQCCGGKVAKVDDTCCAGQTIDLKTQVCCHRTLFTNEKAIEKRNLNHDKCCPNTNGGMSYDSVNFVCSWENRIVNRTSRRNICGRKIYNTRKDLCCNSKVFKNAARRNMACCLPSASVYNPKTHVCCFGVRRKGSRCTKKLYRPRCPKKCGGKKTTLEGYCKSLRGKYNQTSRRFKNIKRQMQSIQRSRSCQCIYRKRTIKANSTCRLKESHCVVYHKLIGILVTRKSGKHILMYYRKRKRGQMNDFCNSAL